MAYSVKKGDTLWAIAVRVFGDGSRWKELYVDGVPAGETDPTKLQIGANVQTPEEYTASQAPEPTPTPEAAPEPEAEPEPAPGDKTPELADPEDNPEEDIVLDSVGGQDDTTVSILYSASMKYFFDPDRGVWYISYSMPNSDRQVFFEATPEQMDAIFGEGQRPLDYTEATFEDMANVGTFSGDIMEMSGEGSFEDEVDRVTQLGLDEGKLPDWASDDPEIMDLIYIAQAEDKSDEWLLEQISNTQSFKDRFVGLDEFMSGAGLSLTEAVDAYLDFEYGVKNIMLRYGLDSSAVDPQMVGDLLAQGHSLTDVGFVFESWQYLTDNKAAMDSFNEVLVANGMQPLDADDQLAFLEGNAPVELYDLWEEASFNEMAQAAGLDIDVEGAIELAKRTEGYSERSDIYGALTSAATNILRFREDIALDRYGIDQEDLIDLSLGLAPRSGVTASELSRNMERALQSARAGIDGPRAKRFQQFNSAGVPQAVSTSRSRAQE